MKYFLSIITINYNNCEGLKKTITSVKEQTYSNYEHIIIDGASTDKSIEVIENNKASFNYWVSEKDTGIYNAMNKGIKQASGKYLQFLNSGDVFTSSQALSNFINHPDLEGDIIYGDYKFENGEKIYPDHLTPYYFMRTSLPHQSTFFKKEVFKKMGGYDETYRIVADRAFYLTCFLSEKFKFQHIEYPLTLFDLQGLSNDPVYKKQKEEEDERMFKDLYGIYYKDLKNYKELQQELGATKRQTINGILKRIKNRLFK